MQQLVELRGVETQHGVLLRDQPLFHEVHRDLHRCRRRAFPAAGLQHVEPPGFHRELDILHVLVVMLELGGDIAQLLVDLRHRVFERLVARAQRRRALARNRRRRADARHHVLALRIDQVFAIEDRRAVRRVARERHARRRSLAQVPEHHRLHVHRRAPVFRNIVQLAIDDRPVAHPAVEHGRNRAPQLLARIIRERTVQLIEHRLLVANDHLFPVLRRKIGVEVEAFALLIVVENMLELVMPHAEHDIGIHMDEPAIAVIGEPVARQLRKARRHFLVQAEVQHRIHHPRHRGARARAHRDEQRVCRIAESLAGLLLQLRQRARNFRLQPRRPGPAGLVIGDAHSRRDRESRRHRQAQLRHLGEVGALAAQQVLHRGIAIRRAAAERIDPAPGLLLACRFTHLSLLSLPATGTRPAAILCKSYAALHT